MRGTFDHRMRNFLPFVFVSQHLLKMHVAPGNRDLWPFWVFFALNAPPVPGRVTKMAITRF